MLFCCALICYLVLLVCMLCRYCEEGKRGLLVELLCRI